MLNCVLCVGDAAAALPQWPDLEADSSQLPPGIDIDDLQAFVTLYRDHCEVRLDDVLDVSEGRDNLLGTSLYRFGLGHAGCRHRSPVQHGGNDLATLLAQRQ